MVHLQAISRLPVKASEEVSIGWIITVIADVLAVIGAALIAKESGTSTS